MQVQSLHSLASTIVKSLECVLHSLKGLYGIAGIDEAGRGPMIGPMVICGILVGPDRLHELVEIGAKDSKTLTHRSRLLLKGKIEKITAKIEMRIITADDIDRLRKRTTLNVIEEIEFASIAKILKPKEIYLDAADVNAERFGRTIGELSGIASKGTKIVSEHKADAKYPIVSAASIIAKVQRDLAIERYHEKYGDFGSGYPNDPKTVKFVRNLVRDGKKLPPIIRKSWESVRKIIDEEATDQTKLS
ncbi:ribonuclease HII [Candidatus Thorarchaeota archaeon]|nr:MAG: ribonuclease HII [Candidatus Thorarchaeota archaeon]